MWPSLTFLTHLFALVYLFLAGKSTLLSCITGRYLAGVTGSILVQYPTEKKKVTIAFVPQKDYLFPQFTVKESLIFASRMKNKDTTDHEVKALKVIQSLNLESCTDVRISGCSGGQIKRVSIGVELISGPNILVLDEPTSGLDSTNAIKCISLLRDLAEKSPDAPAIVATIHQPNHRIFADFHQIYLLSRHGHNIYFGPPTGLVEYFTKRHLQQPENSSPADFAIEVASCESDEVFQQLSHRVHELSNIAIHSTDANANDRKVQPSYKVVPIQKIVAKMRSKRPKSGLTQMYLLMWRSIQASCFKSAQLFFKVFVNIIIAILISLLWADPIGIEDGCWSTDMKKDILNDRFSHEVGKLNPRDAYMDKITKITANCNLLFSTCVYLILVYSIGTVLVIPLEIATVSKEMSNSWYNLRSYFAAKTVSDLPAVLLSILSLESVCWIATKQIFVYWRFASYFSLSVLMGLICESVGVMIGIMLSNDLVSATLVTIAAAFPALLFGGFLIKIADIPWYFKPMTYISYTRYTFEGIIAAVYGYGRCEPGSVDTVNFLQELTSAQNPIEVVTTIVNSFNVTPADAKLYAPIIGVPDEHLRSVINGTLDYLGMTVSTPGEDLYAKSPSLSSASYVMSYFKLGDDVLNNSFVSLILILVAIKLLIFHLLAHRINNH